MCSGYGIRRQHNLQIQQDMKKQKHKDKTEPERPDRDELTQADLQAGVNTVEEQSGQHPPLETADGKNNGALPAAYRGQRTNRT